MRDDAGLSAPATAAPSSWPRLAAGWRQAALVAWIAGVCATILLSLLPNTAPPSEYGFDKLVHGAGYLGLALLAHGAFERHSTALSAALAMIPLGCLIEVAQTFAPPRSGDVWDALADSMGVLVALALGTRARRIACRLTHNTR